jgi:hypothetical protein
MGAAVPRTGATVATGTSADVVGGTLNTDDGTPLDGELLGVPSSPPRMAGENVLRSVEGALDDS